MLGVLRNRRSLLKRPNANYTFEVPNVYRYSSAGTPFRKELQVASFNYMGKDIQLGVGGSAVAGPLIRIDQ